ncbi:hypothetical protein F5Y08DRAFT_81593 [Xylaria arbuscula]|nr:hypothetical protein F5Y08DRAFT_81593 [Xylaria arbuscula]
MDGVSIAGLVGTILGAIFGGGSILQTWLSERRARKSVAKNLALANSLDYGHTQIQNKYNEDFRRLGTPFGRGDELSRSQLQTYTIQLQHFVITLLTSTKDTAATVLPHASSLLSKSNSMQSGVLDTLAGLYQRTSQGNSLRLMGAPAQASSSSSNYSQGGAEFCPNPNFASGGNGWTSSYIACDECSWKEKNFLPVYPINHDWRMDRHVFWRSHARHQKGAYICRICDRVVKGCSEFQNHLRNHGIDKIKRAYGSNSLTRSPRPDVEHLLTAG